MSRPTWPTSRISGVESWSAVCTPTEACVAPGPAGDDRDPRAAGELPVRVGHVRRARLVAADHVAQLGVAQRVEHGQVALAGDAEQEVGAVDAELVDEDLPAAAAHSAPRGRSAPAAASASPRRPGRRTRSSASRPTPPAGRARGRTRSPRCPRRRRRRGRGRSRTTTRAARTRATRPGSRSGSAPAAGRAGPGRGACGGTRRRPAGSRPGRSARASRRRVAPSAPSTSACPSTSRGAVVRLVPLDVVDDAGARLGRDSLRMLGEAEDQWKYWPPSITIVCPVTKSECGPAR